MRRNVLKKIKKLTALILAFILLTAPAAHTANAAEDSPELSARSSILIRADTLSVLYEKNADQPLPMASTTKIMTALIVLETLPLDRTVTVDEKAVGIEGSSMYLEVGEKVKVTDLLFALMLQSANDAAAALAIEVSGSVEAFAGLMNEKAKELGLVSTHFTNPHGLDDEDHYTTARELAVITAKACENVLFRQIVSTKKYSYTTDRKSGIFINHNKLLFILDGCIGVKTGFTKRSGRSLVSATYHDGLLLIAVTIDAPSDWQDHKALHSYGLSLFSHEKSLEENEFTYSVPVVNGSAESVLCGNTSGADVWVDKDSEVRYEVELPAFVYAPVKPGDRIGRIVVCTDGGEIASCDITALEVSENIEYRSLFQKLCDFITDMFV